jgi:hypothetical protein
MRMVALLQRRLRMWLLLQRILAGIGRVLRRPWRHRAQPPTAHVRG